MGSGGLIAVIGDVHGCFNTLKEIYEEAVLMTDEIYSVGDLVDRGRFPKETVDFCMSKGIKCVRGNHEDILLQALENPESRDYSLSRQTIFTICMNLGGRATMHSYIGSNDVNDFHLFKFRLIKLGHFGYINSFPLRYDFPSVVITHAGIVDGEGDIGMMWNRGVPSEIGKIQVFGHTPVSDVGYKENHYLAIDTGCVYGGKLTAAILNPETGELVRLIQKPARIEDL